MFSAVNWRPLNGIWNVFGRIMCIFDGIKQAFVVFLFYSTDYNILRNLMFDV